MIIDLQWRSSLDDALDAGIAGNYPEGSTGGSFTGGVMQMIGQEALHVAGRRLPTPSS